MVLKHEKFENKGSRVDKKSIKVEVKKNRGFLDPKLYQKNITTPKQPPSTTETSQSSEQRLRKALFLGDRNLVNQIRQSKKVFVKKQPQPSYSPPPVLVPFVKPEAVKLKPVPKPTYRPVIKKTKTQRPKQRTLQSPTIKFSQNMLGSIERAEDLVTTREQIRSISSINRAKQKKIVKKNDFIPKEIKIQEAMTLRELASLMSISNSDVLRKYREFERKSTLDSSIDAQNAEILVADFGHIPKIRTSIIDEIHVANSKIENTERRCPIVSVVGHVDHGKTSLLDALRKTQIVKSESGGITQSVYASQVFLGDKFVTFIDTPGHKVFGQMRSKGIKVTDITLLIIAADDGIKEQTIESIKYIKDSGTYPIVVFTKIDKIPSEDVTNIKRLLLDHDICVESMGGNVPEICISAKTGKNLLELVELISVVSVSVLDLKSNTKVPGIGSVLESHLDKYKGPTSTIVIKNGTIKKGDWFVSGKTIGRVKTIENCQGAQIDGAGPSMPVVISGFNNVVEPGDDFFVMEEKRAKEFSKKCLETQLNIVNEVRLFSENDILRILNNTQEDLELSFVAKADSIGALDALCQAIQNAGSDKVIKKIVEKGVGNVTETDVYNAKEFNATVIGFNIKAQKPILQIAKHMNVRILTDEIIYKILDDIEQKTESMLRPKEEKVDLGQAEVRQLFTRDKISIAGCMIIKGVIRRGADAVVIRNNANIGVCKIESLRQGKDNQKEMRAGQECGIVLSDHTIKITQGDIIDVSEIRAINIE